MGSSKYYNLLIIVFVSFFLQMVNNAVLCGKAMCGHAAFAEAAGQIRHWICPYLVSVADGGDSGLPVRFSYFLRKVLIVVGNPAMVISFSIDVYEVSRSEISRERKFRKPKFNIVRVSA